MNTDSSWKSRLARKVLMKPTILLLLCFASPGALLKGQSFQNLDFESANLSSSQSAGPVAITEALPGWTGYLGSNSVPSVLYDTFTLGNASIDIIDSKNVLGQDQIIEGQYTAVLQPGVAPSSDPPVIETASLSQTGLVPANAVYLEFEGNLAAPTLTSLSVSLGGQALSLVTLESGSNYTLYGANISAFAGQIEPLVFTDQVVQPAGGDADPSYIDSISFSTSPVPEPSTWPMIIAGGISLAVISRFRRAAREQCGSITENLAKEPAT